MEEFGEQEQGLGKGCHGDQEETPRYEQMKQGGRPALPLTEGGKTENLPMKRGGG